MPKSKNTHRASYGEPQRGGSSSRINDSGNMPTETGKAAEILVRAREWIKLNPELWSHFETEAMQAAAGRRRISTQQFIEQVRAKDRVNRNGEPVKINNSYAPIFSRILVSEHPEVMPFIELRHSPYFDAYFAPIFETQGGPNG